MIRDGATTLSSREALLEVSPPAIYPGAPDLEFNSRLAPGTALELPVEHQGQVQAALIENTYPLQVRWVSVSEDGTVTRLTEAPLVFETDGSNAILRNVARQPDGKILLGGIFDRLNGLPMGGICRLHSDGTLDTGFQPGGGPSLRSPAWARAVGPILPLADGRILVGGTFDAFSGMARSGLVLLETNGNVDQSWTVPLTTNSTDPYRPLTVTALVTDHAERILIGGSFNTIGGQPRKYLARLHPNGDVDPGFLPPLRAEGSIASLLVQPDGRLLVGGEIFLPVDTFSRPAIRLMANGTLDTTFSAPWPLSHVYFHPAAIQRSGMIVGPTSQGLVRLFPDGTPDESFRVQLGGSVRGLVVQPNDDLIAFGFHGTVNGIPRSGSFRVHGALPEGLRLMGAGFEAGEFVLYAVAVEGQQLKLEYTDDIAIGSWLLLEQRTSDGGLLRFKDRAPSLFQRFYRLREEPESPG